MIYIYSKESLYPILTDTRGDNGDILNTVSFNRKNRNLNIYIKFSLSGSVIPTINRGYFDGDILKYHAKQYGILTDTDTEAIFDYDMFNDKNFRCFNLEFECIEDDTTMIITEIGVRFDTIDSTVDNTLNQSLTKLMKDINGDPLSEQKYIKLNNFSLNINRANVDGVFNVIEKPFYLVDVKDCVDNSTTHEVSCTDPSVEYLTTATKKCKVTLNNIVSTMPRDNSTSNILSVNNNILRESKFKLKVINGESADVYAGNPNSLIANFNLNFGGYWEYFLGHTDHLELPIVDIHSMAKAQSLWYRNTGSLFDNCLIEVAADYRNNIIEFINRSIKSFDLSFESIEELIFVIEVTYINSVGSLSTKPIFVGRPEIKTNSDSQLMFDVQSLDYKMLKNAPFASYVLERNSGSFHNFIDLYQGFANIYNNPHYLNDNVVYPVVPFNLNNETYLPDDPYAITEVPHLLTSDDPYAEDTITGDELGRYQTFYYRLSPECGIATFNPSTPDNVEYSNLGTWRFFTNQSELDSISNRSVRQSFNNAFRMFRPVKTFISDRVINTMKVCIADDDVSDATSPYLNLRTASDSEFRISIGDEIVVCEQMMDFAMKGESSGYYASRIILFNESSNIYYYNKSQNIFYWNPIITGARTLPLPKQWYDMESYLDTGALLRYDINYQFKREFTDAFDTYGNGYRDITFTNNNFTRWQYDAVNHVRRDNNCNTDINSTTKGAPVIANAANPFLLPAWEPSEDGISTQRYIESDREAMEATLDTILSNTSLKTVRITDDLDILWAYDIGYIRNSFSFDTNYNKTACKKDIFNLANGVLDKEDYTNYIHNDIGWTIDYELSTNFGSNQVMLSIGLQGGTVLIQYGRDNNAGIVHTDTLHTGINNNISIADDFAYFTTNYDSIGFEASVINKCVINNVEYPELGIEEWKVYDTRGVILLDINIGLNRVILRDIDDNNYLKYETIDTEVNQLQATQASSVSYLLSMVRTSFGFTETFNGVNYVFYSGNIVAPIRLLSFDGNRYNASIGLANSFFKNMYSDNLGIKQIGIAPTKKIVLTDAEIVPNSFTSTSEQYNQIEWNNYNTIKNKFTGIDNDTATTKESDDLNFDRSFSVSCYAYEDVQMSIKLVRGSDDYNWTVSNEFGEETGSIDPPNYQTFEIDLTGKFSGITIYFNFYDGEINVGETFRGEIEKRTLEANSITDKIISSNKKFVWQDDKVFALKFPFLNNKYSSFFFDVAEEYFLDSENSTIRRLLTASVMIPELILFNENYSIFNIGDVDVEIDSITKYLNGYYVDANEDIQKYNSNKAGFKIEKILYNFKQKQTIFKLVSH